MGGVAVAAGVALSAEAPGGVPVPLRRPAPGVPLNPPAPGVPLNPPAPGVPPNLPNWRVGVPESLAPAALLVIKSTAKTATAARITTPAMMAMTALRDNFIRTSFNNL